MKKPRNANAGQRKIFVGLDVHRDTISVCAYDPQKHANCYALEISSHDPKRLRTVMENIRDKFGEPQCCYEASSCGYTLYRTLHDLGFACEVIAPSSVPRRPGDRVKTDRRDAAKLAQFYAAGLLTVIHVPDDALISERSVVRRRVSLTQDLTKVKQRLVLLLQSRGHVYRAGKNWTQKFWRWLNGLSLNDNDAFTLGTLMAQIDTLNAQIRQVEDRIAEISKTSRYQRTVQELQGFRGIALFTAMQLACELGDIRRFAHPKSLMAYVGLVPSEHSSGSRTRPGPITKTGNAFARRALVSAAWKYTHPPRRSVALSRRQEHCTPAVIAISWRAQQRLHKRYQRLVHRKAPSKAIVAVARELTGFLWEAMQTVPPVAAPSQEPRITAST